jgi:hypothetical protein
LAQIGQDWQKLVCIGREIVHDADKAAALASAEFAEGRRRRGRTVHGR